MNDQPLNVADPAEAIHPSMRKTQPQQPQQAVVLNGEQAPPQDARAIYPSMPNP